MHLTRPAMVLGATAAAVALTLTGCSSGGDDAPSDTGASDAATPDAITVWTWTGAPGEDAMAALAEGFEAETGIAVTSKVVARDDYKSQVQLALNSDESIDVLGVQPSQFALDIQGQLEPVSQWSSHLDGGLDAYNPSTIAQAQRVYGSDEIYSVPFGSTGSAVCFYNADILGDLGVEAPQTWADMKDLTTALATAKPDVLPLVMPAAAPDSWFVDEFVLTMVGQSDPGFYDTIRYDGGSWDTDAYAAAVDRFGELFADGTLDRRALDLGYSDAMNAFNQGNAAIVCNGSWEAGMLRSSFREDNGLAATSIGVMPVPSDDAATRSLRSFLDITWGIPTTAAAPDAAADFIAYATTGAGVDLWAGGLGFIPAASGWELDSAEVFGDDALASESYSEIQQLIAEPSSDRNNLSALSDQAGSYLLEAAQGRMSGADVAAKVQADHESGKFS